MTDTGAPPAGSPTPSLLDRMGIVVSSATASMAVATMPVAGNTQPLGLLHGGASTALAETVASAAAAQHAGAGRHAVGIEISASHLRPVRTGTVTAVARAVHLGGTVATYDVTITDDAARLVCAARVTCLTVAADGADGPRGGTRPGSSTAATAAPGQPAEAG